MKFFFLSVCLVILNGANAQARNTLPGLIPLAQVYGNTFQIIVDSSSGTCFTQDFEDQHFLVTARHLFPSKKSGDMVSYQVRIGPTFFGFKTQVYFYDNDSVDVAVMKQPGDFSPTTTFPLHQFNFIGGQDV